MLEQQNLIHLVKSKGLADEQIAAIMMYGSFTQYAGDRYSDVEFYVFVHDNYFDSFIGQTWIKSICPIYIHVINEHGTEVVIFENLVRGEFHFLPLSQVSIIESFYIAGHFPDLRSMNLCDKAGVLEKALQAMAAKPLDRYSRENIEATIKNLLNLILLGINVYKRGELARSLQVLVQAHNYYLQMLRLLDHSVDHWINPAKQLEKEISAAHYLEVRKCSAPLQKNALAIAYQNLLRASQDKITLLARQYNCADYAQLRHKLQLYADF